MPNKILNWEVEGKRIRGKPTECSIVGVKEACREEINARGWLGQEPVEADH